MSGRTVKELWFELRARTQGLEEDVATAEKRLGSFAKWVLANPVAAMAALTAAAVGAGAAVAKMAEHHEEAMRKIQAASGGAIVDLERLSDGLRALAMSSGRALADLDAAALDIAKHGGAASQDIIERLAAADLAARATGTDLETVVSGLEQTLRTFGLTAASSGAALGTLFAASRGKASLEEVFNAIAKATPMIRANRISIDEMAAAISAAVERGYGGKKLAPFLDSLSLDQIRELAREAPKVADGLAKLAESAALLDSTAERRNRAWAEFKDILLEIGQKVLPVVNAGLSTATYLAQLLKPQSGGSEIQGLVDASRSMDDANKYGILNKAIADTQDLRRRVGAGDLDLSVLPTARLAELRAALAKLYTEQRFRQLQQRVPVGSAQDWATKSFGELSADIDTELAGRGAKLPPPMAGDKTDRLKELREAKMLGLELTTLIDQHVAPSLDKALEAIDTVYAKYVEKTTEALRHTPDLAKPLVEAAEKARIDARQRALFTNDARNVKEEWKQFQQDTPGGFLSEEALTKAADLMDRLRADVTQLGRSSAEGAEAWALQEEIFKRIVQDVGNAKVGYADLNWLHDQTLKKLQLQADVIQQTVTATLQLGEAFGLVDANTANALNSLLQIGTSIPKLIEQLRAFDDTSKTKGAWQAAGDVVGAALPIVGAVVSLIGQLTAEDPRTAEWKRVQEANTEALRELGQHLGDLAKSPETGSTISTAMKVAKGIQTSPFTHGDTSLPLAAPFGPGGASFSEWARLTSEKFIAAGLTSAQIKALAQSLGVTLDDTQDSWIRFVEALKKADLQAFADDFSGSMAKLNAQFAVYNITDPTEKLRRVIKALADPKSGIPAITDVFAGLDVSSAADRETAVARLQQLFELLASGTFDAGILGGGSIGDALQEIQDILAQLRGLGTGEVTSTGVQSANVGVSRTVTEAGAERLIGLAETEVTVLEQMLDHLAAIRGMWASVGTPQAPSVGSVVNNFGPISIYVSVGGFTGSVVDPTQIGFAAGSAAGQAFIDWIDRELGAKWQLAAQLRGQGFDR